MALRLLLIRHAETDVAKKNLLLGSTEVNVCEEGLDKLGRFNLLMDDCAPEEWYCSPMNRARQTVDKIVDVCGFGQEVRVDERLREIDFGRWEMRSFADISLSDPALVDRWAEYDSFIFPDGEAVVDFQGRVADVFSALCRLPAKEVGVVTHGGVVRTMICLALGQNPKNYLLYNVLPGTLTVLDIYPTGGVLTGLNL